MQIIPYYPTEYWGEMRRKLLVFVTVGVIGVLFATLLFLPVTYTKAAQVVGKKALSFTLGTVNLAQKAGQKTIGTVNTALQKISINGKTAIATLGRKAREAIQFIQEIIQNLYQSAGKTVKIIIRKMQDIKRVMTNATKFILKQLFNLSEKAIDGLQKALEQIMKTLKWSGEKIYDFFIDLFYPHVRTCQKTVGDTGSNGSDIFQKLLPRYAQALNFMIKISFQLQVSEIPLHIFASFIALAATGINKIYNLTIGGLVGKDSVFVKFSGKLIEIFKKIVTTLKEIIANICDVVVGIVDKAFSYFPSLPGGIELNKCSGKFIRMGLKFMTQGAICGDNDNPNTVSEFATCVWDQIGYVNFTPEINFGFSATDIWNFTGLPKPFPVDKMLALVPGIRIRIPALNLALLGGEILKDFLIKLANQAETFMFTASKAAKSAIISVVTNPKSSLTFIDLALQMAFRLVGNVAGDFLKIVTDVVINKGLCRLFDVKFGVKVKIKIKSIRFWEWRIKVDWFRLSDFFNCSSLIGGFVNQILSVLGFTNNIGSATSFLAGKLLGGLVKGAGAW